MGGVILRKVETTGLHSSFLENEREMRDTACVAKPVVPAGKQIGWLIFNLAVEPGDMNKWYRKLYSFL